MHIVIIGNGISGITAARQIRKLSTHQITVISEESDYFFSRTALMYCYMGHMRLEDMQPYENHFWDKNQIQRVRTRIERIDFEARILFDNLGNSIPYDRLMLALGSKPNLFGWPGQFLDGVHGLYHLKDLEAMERHSKNMQARCAVIVGGGLIGVEMAEMFHSRGIPVHFLVREKAYWHSVLPLEEAQMVGRHLEEHGIQLQFQTELAEILPDLEGKKCAGVRTHRGEIIACGFVGITAGVSPNVDFLRETSLKINRGILVDPFLKTNIPHVWAAGDCVELSLPASGRKAIEAVWYTGRMMGETAAYNLCDHPKSYLPGIWFNSAKFFDIEYQVYGDIRPELPENQETLYWEHPSGKKSIRINYLRSGGAVLGFNLMGIRYRQEVCLRWIEQGSPIETVLQNLGLANFDPEFSPQYESELVDLYNRQHHKNIQLKQKRGLRAVLHFLNR